MPHAVLTFSGGRVYRRFSGHAGMDEAVPTIRDLTSKNRLSSAHLGFYFGAKRC